ncbi:hypothetical protein BR93DRAFT_279781 [Coniochaeta sp. PMI_546]|nr:hypothetical protein BR93DRAFT_279781 [Coniochaeta sp. PMI_546]
MQSPGPPHVFSDSSEDTWHRGSFFCSSGYSNRTRCGGGSVAIHDTPHVKRDTSSRLSLFFFRRLNCRHDDQLWACRMPRYCCCALLSCDVMPPSIPRCSGSSESDIVYENPPRLSGSIALREHVPATVSALSHQDATGAGNTGRVHYIGHLWRHCRSVSVTIQSTSAPCLYISVCSSFTKHPTRS